MSNEDGIKLVYKEDDNYKKIVEDFIACEGKTVDNLWALLIRAKRLLEEEDEEK